ncbi:MAG: relaxase [Pseudomonadota bacterium]
MGLIVFGSQRGGGSDLAIHLMNGEDNEYVERMESRGSVADDTPGAFAEYEAIAHSMTNCKKYLYSLSINPDPTQPRFSHTQYMDYIERAETSLGLSGQPREIYKHIKEDKAGRMREHYHCVWSRIDVQECKAIHIAFDKSKLMNVTRQFALDHNLILPDGYHTGIAKADQLTLYEKAQSDQTGLSKEERMDLITDLWRRSDSSSAFVAALGEHGYMLATGKRPYVLVDIHGYTNALPKMINDKQVRTQDIRAFLGTDYAPESLPTVEEAQEMAKSFIVQGQQLELKERHATDFTKLENSQEQRRAQLAADIEKRNALNEFEARQLASHQAQKTSKLHISQAAENLRVQFERAERTPKGLAGTLARFSGVSFVRSKLHNYEDSRRDTRHELQRQGLHEKQNEQRRMQSTEHQLKMAELYRRRNNQERVFERERRTLTRQHSKEHALLYRRGFDHMPAVNLTLTPAGRPAAPHKAMRRHISQTVKDQNVRSKTNPPPEIVDVQRDFERAAKKRHSVNSTSGKSPTADFRVRSPDRKRKK